MNDAEARCTFCRRVWRDSGPLVEAPDASAYICRDCAKTVLVTIRESSVRAKRDTIVGIVLYAAMLILGAILVWHFMFGQGRDSVLGWVAVGALVIMGLLPMYGAVFGVWYPFGPPVEQDDIHVAPRRDQSP